MHVAALIGSRVVGPASSQNGPANVICVYDRIAVAGPGGSRAHTHSTRDRERAPEHERREGLRRHRWGPGRADHAIHRGAPVINCSRLLVVAGP